MDNQMRKEGWMIEGWPDMGDGGTGCIEGVPGG